MRIIEEALTFDDVLLVPGHSTVLPADADLRTKITRDFALNIPLVSAAMDTVTESSLAIALAQEGGMGFIHKNMSIEQQANHVRRVKKFESGIVSDPITVTPDTTVGQLKQMTQQHGISGMPVVEGDHLVGIVTNRDIRFETRDGQPVSSVMTPKERLVTVEEGASQEEILDKLHTNRIEKLLVVNDNFELKGLITVKDINNAETKPNACKDRYGHLRVGAAVGTGAETPDRVSAIVEAGVDIILVDTSHGHSQGVLDRVKWVKDNYPEKQVIGGNVATGAGARALVDAGADGVKVGIGPGSICTTRIVTGVGVPQISAISSVAKELEGTGIPFIADGGIRFSGDMCKALAAGAYSVMVGSMLAGTEEAPGEVELYQGRSYKSYRGMGSLGAMSQKNSSADRYFQSSNAADKLVPEGIEGRVPYKGYMMNIVHQMMGGLRSSMGLTGCKNIEEMRTKAQFVRVTNAGMSESHVHDVSITKEAPNYRV
ncbi:IMP dehydrogenase [Kangiella sediminilitoris]|uniref:Inosine-5'-monophosphate dehydrogenase n=1 Tax=Kangiella sediminilitoris TaxID=1144748 RepID=A0A1B3BBW7_9GAMM|nr:IMP dehydrogenase [Kangiella sediminilitoris]AOE50288.1 inosine 5''''-monophosphate dehydrogenase [Kangiella sediminilitoris]